MNKGAQIAFATLAAFAGLVWVIASGTADPGTFRYYQSVNEYLVKPPAAPAAGQQLRVHGFSKCALLRLSGPGHQHRAIGDKGYERRVREGQYGRRVDDHDVVALVEL